MLLFAPFGRSSSALRAAAGPSVPRSSAKLRFAPAILLSRSFAPRAKRSFAAQKQAFALGIVFHNPKGLGEASLRSILPRSPSLLLRRRSGELGRILRFAQYSHRVISPVSIRRIDTGFGPAKKGEASLRFAIPKTSFARLASFGSELCEAEQASLREAKDERKLDERKLAS